MEAVYTPAEDQYLIAHYPNTAKAAVMARFPDRPWSSIQARASRVNVCRSREIIIADRATWHPARLAVLHEFYPIGGAAVVLVRMIEAGLSWSGCTVGSITSRAHGQGLKMIRIMGQQRKQEREAARVERLKASIARLTAKAAPKPKPAPAAAKPLPRPVGESAKTPLLNHRAALKRMTKEQCRQSVSITADAVKKLSPLHPGRQAYTINGAAGYSAWLAGSVS